MLNRKPASLVEQKKQHGGQSSGDLGPRPELATNRVGTWISSSKPLDLSNISSEKRPIDVREVNLCPDTAENLNRDCGGKKPSGFVP